MTARNSGRDPHFVVFRSHPKNNYNRRFRFIGVERYQWSPASEGLYPIPFAKNAKG